MVLHGDLRCCAVAGMHQLHEPEYGTCREPCETGRYTKIDRVAPSSIDPAVLRRVFPGIGARIQRIAGSLTTCASLVQWCFRQGDLDTLDKSCLLVDLPQPDSGGGSVGWELPRALSLFF